MSQEKARRRLLRDFRNIQSENAPGYTAVPEPENIFKWNAVIFGPEKTDWEDGVFKLTMIFTDEYPHRPPEVKFTTPVFHPNVYKSGAICLDVLQANWSSANDVSSILVSIQSLLTDPNPASPANAEAARLYTENRPEYMRRVHQFYVDIILDGDEFFAFLALDVERFSAELPAGYSIKFNRRPIQFTRPMSRPTEAQLKPIVNKFNKLIDEIENGDPKRALKQVKAFEKTKFPPNSPPFVLTAHAVLHFKKGEYEQAVTLARQVEQEKPTELSVCNNVLHIFKHTNMTDDLQKLYARVREMRPNEPEIVLWDITLYLMLGDFAKAQECAMTLMKMEHKSVTIIFAACCAWLRATGTGNPLFHKFAVAFLDKAREIVTPELLEMRLDSMIALGQTNEALQLMETNEVKEKLSYDMLSMLRTQIKAYTKSEDWTRVGEVAAKILREVNDDSLDEWKLVVKYHPQASEIIEEIAKKNEKLRGPQLARIELALKNGQDIVSLVHAYIEKYSGRGHLLGDIRPYLTPEVLAKLPDVTDVSVNCLKKNAFCGEVTDPRTASMKAEELMIAGKFKEAAEVCAPYATEPDTRCMLIRLAGLMNCSVAQRELWIDQKLEAIQYLSLSNWWLLDAMRCWDIQAMEYFLEKTSNFLVKGEAAFSGHVTAALNNFNAFTLLMCVRFRHELVNHPMSYMTNILLMWLKIMQGKEEPTLFKLEKIRNAADFSKFVPKFDESAIPLYFSDENLKKRMYPDIVETVQCFSAVMKVVLLLGVNSKVGDEELDECTRVVAGTAWEPFTVFVKGGCKELPPAPDAGIVLFGSMALAAKYTGTLGAVKESIVAAVRDAATKVEQAIPSDLPAVFAGKLEEQKARIQEAVDLVAALH